MSQAKLFIHIGTQKTGSTTIQHALEKHSNQLKKEGIVYLGRLTELAREIRCITKTDPALVQTLRKNISQQIHDGGKAGRYVISNEKFAGNKMIGYKNTPVIAKTLFNALDPLGIDVKIIVYLRRQDDFLESTYAQRIYSGETLSFEEFFEKFDKTHFHWDKMVDSYAKYFGKANLIVKRYDEQYLPNKDSIINTFGICIGSNFLENYSQTEFKNQGFIRDTLEIERLANKSLNKKDVRLMRTLLREVGSKDLYERYSFFTMEQRKQFLEIYKHSNAKVAKEYFQNNSGSLFSPINPDKYKDGDYKGLTVEKAVYYLTNAIVYDHSQRSSQADLQKKKGNIFKKILRRTFK